MTSLEADSDSSFLGTGSLDVSPAQWDGSGIVLHMKGHHQGDGTETQHSRRVLELLKQLGRNGEVVAPSKGLDLADVSERSAHDDGLVAVLLVVAGVSTSVREPRQRF